MNLKCYICGNDAEYLVNGTSFCKDHCKPKPTEKQKPLQFPPVTGAPGVRT